MEKAVYNLVLLHENMPLSGGKYKLVGVKEGKILKDYISKNDRILGMRGSIEMFGDVDKIANIIILDDNFELDI